MMIWRQLLKSVENKSWLALYQEVGFKTILPGSQIEDYTLQRKILILSIFHEDLARLKPKSFGVAYNHEIYFHCSRGIGNVN